MEVAVKPLFIGLSSEITSQKQGLYLNTRVPFSYRMRSFIHMSPAAQQSCESCNSSWQPSLLRSFSWRRVPLIVLSSRKQPLFLPPTGQLGYYGILSLQLGSFLEPPTFFGVASPYDFRASEKVSRAVHVIPPGLESGNMSTTSFKDFTVVVVTYGDREIKIRVDVSGAKTRAIFDDVFSKLVAAAQPIPGFRRVKGGKTPDIPKDVLMHVLGPSKVNKQTIKKIINSIVAEYVEKECLKVTKDLRIEQSFEELEATLEPGEEFGFDAIIQLQEISINKS